MNELSLDFTRPETKVLVCNSTVDHILYTANINLQSTTQQVTDIYSTHSHNADSSHYCLPLQLISISEFT